MSIHGFMAQFTWILWGDSINLLMEIDMHRSLENDSFFAVSYPMEKKSSAGQALKQFIAEFGIPDRIICDGSGEQMGKRTEFTVTVRKHGIVVEFLGLTALNSLLQYVNWLVWEVCSVN